MDLRTVLSVSGKPGLFKLIAHQTNGVVVESLVDGKRTAISANANVSSLGDIAIYTYEEEVPLRDVFKAMAEVTEGKEALSHKSSKDQLEDFFGEVLPKFDQERVYASDIKKVVQWFNILVKNDLLSILEEEVSEEAE
jgi:argininosuccinate lyase